MYAMFIVLNNVKKLDQIINKLSDIGIKGATVIDTMGSAAFTNNYLAARPAIGSALRALEDIGSFNKTIVSIVYCEKHVIEAMDAVEEILGGDITKKGAGIIFTIPVECFRGGELDRYLQEKISDK
jgi:nitrogen regulatory protein PII